MPLPLLFIAIAAATGLVGVGKSVKAAVDDIHDANKTDEKANDIVNAAKNNLKEHRRKCENNLKKLGKTKVTILDSSVNDFIKYFGQLKNVEFKESSGLNEMGKLCIDSKDFNDLKDLGNFATNILISGVAGGAMGGALMGLLIVGAKASKTKDEAYSNLAKAKQISAECRSASDLCDAISTKCGMFISLLDKLDKYFKPLIKKIQEAINEHGTDYTSFSKEQKQATAVAASLAKAIKTVLDTPVLDKNGNITYESDLVLRNIKPDEIVHGTCSEQNSSKLVTIKELSVNDIITQCKYNIEYRPEYRPYFLGSNYKEEYANININLLVKLMNYSYGLQATKEEYVSAISTYNIEDKYRVSSLEQDLTRFIETSQIALIVEECIIHFTSELRREDIDWDKLIYKIKTIYKVRMEKWQLFTPGKNTFEIVMKRIYDKITYSRQPTIFVKSEFQRLDRL